MAYASITHVQAHNAGRGAYTSSTKPTASQVVQFIDEAAGEIDIALAAGGYNVPLPSSVPSSVAAYLQKTNAYGALCFIESSAQVSHNRDDYCSMFKQALKMFERGRLPGLEKDSDVGLPRGDATATPPYFTRDMQL
jgi:hypothetical protein